MLDDWNEEDADWLKEDFWLDEKVEDIWLLEEKAADCEA